MLGNLARAFFSGLAGALTLTALHESLRQIDEDAPRMDKLGMRALASAMLALDHEPPSDETLYGEALAGDIAANSLYYAFVDGERPWLRGTVLGLLAGIGAVTAPPQVGLGNEESARTSKTALMTVGLYLAGGLAAAATSSLLRKER